MNYRLVAKFLAFFAGGMSLLILPAVFWALYFGELETIPGMVASVAIGCTVGSALYAFGRKAPDQLYQREALALVAFAWLTVGILGALPFYLSSQMPLVDALFESISGFTTTGASILTTVEDLPKGLLFWRSFTHWLGGMGIVVLFIAVLPYLGAGGKQLFRREASGPEPQGLKPRIRASAVLLYKIYLGLTVLQVAALMVTGKVGLYSALCHTFGTIASGGFSIHTASIGYYDSVAVEIIVILFMVFAGTNFALYYYVLNGRWKSFIQDPEWRAFIVLLGSGVLLIALDLNGHFGEPDLSPVREESGDVAARETPTHAFGSALRIAAFNVVSIATNTGYATADFDQWSHSSRIVLVVLMLIGGCGGSTSGGLKVIRFVLLSKLILYTLERTFRPKTVRALRLGDAVVTPDIQHAIMAFFFIYVAWLVFGSVVMSAIGLPLVTAVTATAATMTCTGPGLELVGPAANYAFIPVEGKLFLCLSMLVGRVEMYSVLVLFVPAFWRIGH